MPRMQYPIVPKSNRLLVPGHFWAIPLSNGAYAAGRVLAVNPDDRSTFIAGLMDWSGPAPPTSEDLVGHKTIEQGQAHDLTIVDTGPAVTGFRALELDGLGPDLRLSQAGWPNPWLQLGYELLRPAAYEEWQSLPVFSGWGRSVIQALAEKVLVRGEPLFRDRKHDFTGIIAARNPLH